MPIACHGPARIRSPSPASGLFLAPSTQGKTPLDRDVKIGAGGSQGRQANLTSPGRLCTLSNDNASQSTMSSGGGAPPRPQTTREAPFRRCRRRDRLNRPTKHCPRSKATKRRRRQGWKQPMLSQKNSKIVKNIRCLAVSHRVQSVMSIHLKNKNMLNIY